MGSIVGLAQSGAFVGRCFVAGEGSKVLEQGLGSGLAAPAALVGPAGRSAPWVGHVLRGVGASCVGASSFAIRTRL